MSHPASKPKPVKTVAENRKARHDYHILDVYETGIVLVGSEAKAIRIGRANLKDSFARVVHGELFLFGAHVSHLESAYVAFRPDERRARKLLMHKIQITRLAYRVQTEGVTLVPLSLVLNEKGKVKVQLALAKGKTHGDKRESEKEKDAKREAQSAMKKSWKDG